MGYRATTAQLFTVPPNMAAFVTVLITAYLSDRIKQRGIFIAGGAIVGICGYIMLLVAKTNAVRYAGTFLVAIGVFQGSPMIMVSYTHMMLSRNSQGTGLDLEQRRTALRASSCSRHRHLHCELLCFHWNIHLSPA